MCDKINENDESLTEWVEELEIFLRSDDGIDPSLQQQKEKLLQSLVKQIIDNSGEDEAKGIASVPKMETKSYFPSQLKCFIYFVLLCFITFVLIKCGYCQGKSLKLCWSNNIQDWIYPVLRAVRLLALPVIHYLPSISDIHEDTCLVKNPLYWDQEVDCTLCQDVGIVTLSKAYQFEELFYHRGVPVVVQDAVPVPVSLRSLRDLYIQYRKDITAGSAVRLERAPPALDSLGRLLAASGRQLAQLQHCIQWRLLRVSAVRHLRQLFTRPYFISKKTEVSLHRHIFICGDEGERHPLPMTEFANVWVSQHSGTRQIRLVPSNECSAICRPVSALLRPGETLFYNWRYWRASSLPVDDVLLSELDTSEGQAQVPDVPMGADSPESPGTPPEESHGAGVTPPGVGQESTGTCSPAVPWGAATKETRTCPSVPGGSQRRTDAAPVGERRSAGANGDRSEAAAGVCPEGEAAGDEGQLTAGRARSGGRPSSPEQPTVGITFVGSFY